MSNTNQNNDRIIEYERMKDGSMKIKGHAEDVKGIIKFDQIASRLPKLSSMLLFKLPFISAVYKVWQWLKNLLLPPS